MLRPFCMVDELKPVAPKAAWQAAAPPLAARSKTCGARAAGQASAHLAPRSARRSAAPNAAGQSAGGSWQRCQARSVDAPLAAVPSSLRVAALRVARTPPPPAPRGAPQKDTGGRRGAGTVHTRDTRAQRTRAGTRIHTDEPHKHPNPTTHPHDRFTCTSVVTFTTHHHANNHTSHRSRRHNIHITHPSHYVYSQLTTSDIT